MKITDKFRDFQFMDRLVDIIMLLLMPILVFSFVGMVAAGFLGLLDSVWVMAIIVGPLIIFGVGLTLIMSIHLSIMFFDEFRELLRFSNTK